MTTLVAYGDVEVGEQLPNRSFAITRADLVRYAGASGDFNPIHWNARFAVGVGLPDVIAHGMFTMATAAGWSPTGSAIRAPSSSIRSVSPSQ